MTFLRRPSGRRPASGYARCMRAAAALVCFLAGCPAEDPCAAEPPTYGGLGNDEVWLALKDAKANATHDGDFPTVTSPAAGATVPAGTAPTFSWESPLKIALGPTTPQPLYRAHRSLFDDLSELVIPSAHAHLAPVSSDAYLAEVFVPGRECPVPIVTTELSHVLDSYSWDVLKEAAGEPLTLQLTSAYLASGRITEGPYKADDVTFTVE